MILSHPRSPSARRRSAFTLLEVLVVVAIILVLASVATVAVLNVQKENKNDMARLNAISLEKAVKLYMVKHDNVPPQNLQDAIDYIDNRDQSKLIDPWNNPYQLGTNEAGNPYVYTTNPETGEVIRSDVKRQQ
jgi:general secretion pathway protein G